MNLNTSFLLSEARQKAVASERLAAEATALRAARQVQPSARERLAQTLVEIAAKLSPEAARVEAPTPADPVGRIYSKPSQEPKPCA